MSQTPKHLALKSVLFLSGLGFSLRISLLSTLRATAGCWNCSGKWCPIQWGCLPGACLSQALCCVWQLLLTPFWNTIVLAFTHLFLPVLLIHELLCGVFCLCLPSTVSVCPQDPLPMPGYAGSLRISSTYMPTSCFTTYMLTSRKPSTELQAHII